MVLLAEFCFSAFLQRMLLSQLIVFCKELFFARCARGVARKRTVGAQDAVAGNEETERIAPHRATDSLWTGTDAGSTQG